MQPDPETVIRIARAQIELSSKRHGILGFLGGVFVSAVVQMAVKLAQGLFGPIDWVGFALYTVTAVLAFIPAIGLAAQAKDALEVLEDFRDEDE